VAERLDDTAQHHLIGMGFGEKADASPAQRRL
jgi:hypothetical protein